mmetsp:Transcript_19362/g.31722  ORF Transcript_19362/g.31722 Transcript_19362/m.31722 type:complete len:198 (-) Transcript_19362:300-893(-)
MSAMVRRTFGAFVALFLFATNAVEVSQAFAVETPPYKVIQLLDEYEIRTYASSKNEIWAKVAVSASDLRDGQRKGHDILNDYFNGGNDRQEKIPLTAPETISYDGSQYVVSFFIPPREYPSLDYVPKPSDEAVYFGEEGKRKIAAMSYAGFVSEEDFDIHVQRLQRYMTRDGVQWVKRAPALTQYGATMARSNEIWL